MPTLVEKLKELFCNEEDRKGNIYVTRGTATYDPQTNKLEFSDSIERAIGTRTGDECLILMQRSPEENNKKPLQTYLVYLFRFIPQDFRSSLQPQYPPSTLRKLLTKLNPQDAYLPC
jgi:hypothetical protein